MDYEKKYKDALAWMRDLYPELHGAAKEDAEHYFPELKESEDERIRKALLKQFSGCIKDEEFCHTGFTYAEITAWLEKQKERNWIPTDEQRHALGMVIKYSDPDADSTKVLESLLDELTKIANPKVAKWKEKQKESLHKQELCKEKAECFTDGAEKLDGKDLLYVADKSYKIGFRDGVNSIKPIEWSEEDELKMNALLNYLDPDKGGTKYSSCAQLEEWSNWLKSLRPQPHWKPSEEQKPIFYPGDVIKCTSTGSLWVRCKDRDNIRSDGHTACIGGGYELASEEEAVQFFQELNENGYQWDCIKGRPMKKE